MENNELVAVVLIVLIVTVGAYFTVGVVFQPKQSSDNIQNLPLTTAVPISTTTTIPQTIQTPIVLATQTSMVTSTKSPTVGPLISICSWQLDELAQFGSQGIPYPLIHTYIAKYNPKLDPNYEVNTQTKYSQYWMNPTSGRFDPTLTRPLLSLTNRDSNTHAYFVQVNFYTSDVKLLTTDNGYSWTNVQPKQTVVAEVIAPENAACYKITKVCALRETDASLDCSKFDVNAKT